jgi:hypothetical protein
LSLETVLLLETLLSLPREVDLDLKEEGEGVDRNYIKGLLNQTLNRVIYINRINRQVILIKRVNSGRSST